jgi:ThiF family
MNLRIAEFHFQEMRRLTSISFLEGIEFPPETGCILLVGRNDHASRPALLVHDVLPPLEGELTDQETDGLVFSSRYLRRALMQVREKGLAGFLTVHTHPFSDEQVRFSPYDDLKDPALMANLYDLHPDGAFGSLVLGGRSAVARTWRADGSGFDQLRELVIIGEQIDALLLDGSARSDPPPAAEIFDRSLAITGRGALAQLSRMCVGIVGASGTGSLVAELLARAGAGEIVLFDFDCLEESNLNRVLHSRRSDAESGADKATRLANAINELGLATRVAVIETGDVRREEVALELRGCDLIFGCIDKDWPRLILSEVSFQYLIPYIDLGTEVGMSDILQSLDSRVSYVAPGRPCLVCSGIISPERVRLEGYEDDELDRVIAMGYSGDIRLAAPSVMDLNMRAASYAVLIARHLLQPFLSLSLPPHIKESLTNYSVRAVRHQARAECVICNSEGRTGKGDSLSLTIRSKRPWSPIVQTNDLKENKYAQP